MINYTSNEKAMIILLIVELIKRKWYKWVNIFLNLNLPQEMWKLN